MIEIYFGENMHFWKFSQKTQSNSSNVKPCDLHVILENYWKYQDSFKDETIKQLEIYTLNFFYQIIRYKYHYPNRLCISNFFHQKIVFAFK
jgi:hypothetical protein